MLQKPKYTFGDDGHINEEIVNIITWQNDELDKLRLIMKDDIENYSVSNPPP